MITETTVILRPPDYRWTRDHPDDRMDMIKIFVSRRGEIRYRHVGVEKWLSEQECEEIKRKIREGLLIEVENHYAKPRVYRD